MLIGNILIFLILGIILYIQYIRDYILARRKFNCLRCNNCCRLKVILTKDDINRINESGKKDFLDSSGKYMKIINGYCIFYRNKDNLSFCSINDIKPEICRTFPYKKGLFGKKYDSRCKNFHKKLF